MQVALGLPCAAAPERLRLRILSVQALAAEQARWEDECEDLVSPSNAKAAKIVRPTPPHLRSRHLRGDCLGDFFPRWALALNARQAELQEALAILEESRTASRESSPVKAPAEPASEGQ